MSGIFQLEGQVKHYDWGGDAFLPKLLAQENPRHLSFAEYWMGTHPQGAARLITTNEGVMLLSDQEPNLSFLLKVLDVRNMLSIQVHPNREMAAEDFDRENRSGIPLDSPNRNYKDPNHKPELMVALSDFWLLHGFRMPHDLQDTFDRFPFLLPLQQKFTSEGYAGLYKWVMEMPQGDVNQLLQEPLHALSEKYEAGALEKSDPCFWAARAHKIFSKDGAIDRGIFSIFLFNLVGLKRGQGIFQGAGVPHAYLEGQNVEIMANSDNVLRGGLTPKHIDVPELLRHIRPEPIVPDILDPQPDELGFRTYPAPVTDFSIRSVSLQAGQSCPLRTSTSAILLVPEGKVQITREGCSLLVGSPTPSAYLLAGGEVQLQALDPALLFIASTGGLQVG